jgi:formylglycine-generating enzyme required for sulfatase activity
MMKWIRSAAPLLTAAVLLTAVITGCGGDRTPPGAGMWYAEISTIFNRLESAHPDLYRKTTREELATARSTIEDSLDIWSDERIIVEISRLLALIGDGHTGIERTSLDERFRRLPIELRYFGPDLVVTAAAPGYEQAIGTKLVSIGDSPISKLVSGVRPLISYDNYAEWLHSVPDYISYGEVLTVLDFSNNPFNIDIALEDGEGKENRIRLATIHPDSLDKAGWIRTIPVRLEEVESGRTFHIRFTCGTDPQSLVDMIPARAERLILDLRSACCLGRGFVQPTVQKLDGWKQERLGNDIVVIVGRGTFSGGVELATRLGMLDGVVLAGELPRGAPNLTSTSGIFKLRGSGLKIGCSTGFETVDANLADSKWLRLDIHVTETWEDYKAGRDVFLETAMSCNTSSPPEDDNMVLIPAAEFMMGGPEDDIYAPARKVFVDSFYIDRYEVTNAQYQKFCEEKGKYWPEFWGMDEYRCGPDYPDHPVVGISLHQAKLYAEWAGKRIPTEAEWELAARGGLVGKKFPTGDHLLPTEANYRVGSNYIGTVPIGCYPPNRYGLHDMSGNVVEWVSDIFHPDYYRISPYKNPTGPEKGYLAVIRGGGWHSGKMCCNVYTRNALKRSWVDIAVGFRCAR